MKFNKIVLLALCVMLSGVAKAQLPLQVEVDQLREDV